MSRLKQAPSADNEAFKVAHLCTGAEGKGNSREIEFRSFTWRQYDHYNRGGPWKSLQVGSLLSSIQAETQLDTRPTIHVGHGQNFAPP